MTSWLFEAAARVRAVFLRRRLDRNFKEELEAHIALAAEDNIARGLDSEAAQRDAVLKVGNRGALQEMYRDAGGVRWLEEFLQDARHSVRLLRRSPLFTLSAAVSLTIGIGADATVFTAANALLFRSPAGVVEPGRLVEITRTIRGQFGVVGLSYPEFQDIRRRASLLDDVYLYEPMPRTMTITGHDGAESVFGETVSLNYFHALRVASAAGQLFPANLSDDSRNNPFVVLSYTFWQKRFSGDPSIIGKTLRIDGDELQVIGIAAPGFQGVSIVAPDVWLPIGSTPRDAMRFTARDVSWALIGGRLKPGVTVVQASAQLSAIGAGLAKEYPSENEPWNLRAAALSLIPANLVAAIGGIFALLMAFVSLVLLVACGNIASVLLSRAAARRQELAVRLAIGAGRSRLVRQFITETLMIFLIGAGGGLLLSRGLMAIVISRIPQTGVPVNLPVSLDGRIVGFIFALSFISAVLCGLGPALQASKVNVATMLKDEGQALTQRTRLQNVFVIGQVAFSAVLVVAAGLFLGALRQVSSIPLGYDPHNVEIVMIDFNSIRGNNEAAKAFVRQLSDRLRGLPGVAQTTVATFTPLETGRIIRELKRKNASAPPLRPAEPSVRISWNSVQPGYFATMGIPLVSGRDFTADDREDSQAVAIVSEATARQLWPGEDPMGRSLPSSVGDDEGNALVIGVARDVKPLNGPAASAATIYRPLMQRFAPRVIAVRTRGGRRLSGDIRALLFSMDPNVSVLSSQTLDEAVGEATLPQRNAALVTGSLGLVGLLLASIGVYGVTSHTVTRRTREIGIRVALGAERPEIVRLILREGMSLVATGVAIGLTVAYAASRLLPHTPLNVPAADAPTLGGAGALFLVIGLIACWVPVRRATRIDAITALRYE